MKRFILSHLVLVVILALPTAASAGWVQGETSRSGVSTEIVSYFYDFTTKTDPSPLYTGDCASLKSSFDASISDSDATAKAVLATCEASTSTWDSGCVTVNVDPANREYNPGGEHAAKSTKSSKPYSLVHPTVAPTGGRTARYTLECTKNAQEMDLGVLPQALGWPSWRYYAPGGSAFAPNVANSGWATGGNGTPAYGSLGTAYGPGFTLTTSAAAGDDTVINIPVIGTTLGKRAYLRTVILTSTSLPDEFFIGITDQGSAPSIAWAALYTLDTPRYFGFYKAPGSDVLRIASAEGRAIDHATATAATSTTLATSTTYILEAVLYPGDGRPYVAEPGYVSFWVNGVYVGTIYGDNTSGTSVVKAPTVASSNRFFVGLQTSTGARSISFSEAIVSSEP